MTATQLRRLAPLLIVAAGFILGPILVHRLFPYELRTTMLDLRATPAPLAPVEFQDDAGRKITLDRFHGRFVLLNFWATWCPPCKAEMPSLNSLASHFPTTDLSIVPVSIDAAGVVAARSYYAELRLDRLQVYVDPSMDAMHAIAAVGIPTTLLLDRDGREIGRLVGAAQWDSPAIMEGLAKVLAR